MARLIREIEQEMRDLYEQKRLAYIDYCENIGSDEELRDRLWNEFDKLRTRWNNLVEERNALKSSNKE